MDYLNDAFNYAEQIKALLLLEQLTDKIAKDDNIIPKELLDRERELILLIAKVKKDLIIQRDDIKSKQKLFELKEELDELSRVFEKSYPRYYELKYNFKPLSIEECQEKILDIDEALIEYFVGDSTLIRFVLTKDNVSFSKDDLNSELKDLVFSLENQIRTPPNSENSKRELNQFVEKSFAIKELLLDNTLKELAGNIKSLIIIPDDFLNIIPFDLLVTSTVKEDVSSYKSKSS